MKNADLQQRKNAATPRGVGVMCDFYAARAENSELWDVEGRRYIDFAAGIAVLNTGHRHPKLVAAIKQQLDQFTHTAYQIVPYASYVELAERINTLAPGAFPKKTALFSTGAEAVENAIKIARAATGRAAVIAFSGGFHGRTMMGMALTGKVVPYKVGFGPFPGDVYHVPFPSALHDISTEDSLAAIQALFKSDVEAKRVAAIIIEPVQGEGGFQPAPPELMRGLRRICDEHGILLIADEVQTGFARTGKLFAMEHYDVAADFMGEGYFASHIRKMRLLYAERLQLLQAAIREFLPPQLVIMGGEAGLHLTLMLPAGCSDQAISAEARAAGIIARPLSRYYMHAATARQGLLLGYANTENEQIRPVFKRLAQIILRHLPPQND